MFSTWRNTWSNIDLEQEVSSLSFWFCCASVFHFAQGLYFWCLGWIGGARAFPGILGCWAWKMTLDPTKSTSKLARKAKILHHLRLVVGSHYLNISFSSMVYMDFFQHGIALCRLFLSLFFVLTRYIYPGSPADTFSFADSRAMRNSPETTDVYSGVFLKWIFFWCGSNFLGPQNGPTNT